MSPDIAIVRLEARDMARITIVVRCGGVAKTRLRCAMWLVRLAARIGGFRRVTLVREPTSESNREG
jgi:hypothetical protein